MLGYSAVTGAFHSKVEMSADNIAGRRMGLPTVDSMIEIHKSRRDYESWLWQTEYVTRVIYIIYKRPNVPLQKLVLQNGSIVQPLVVTSVPRATEPSFASLGEVAARNA